MNKCVN